MSLFLFENGKAVGDTFIQFFEFTKKAWHTVWKHIKRIKIRFSLSKRILCSPHIGKTWSFCEASNWISFGQIENVWALQIRLVGGKRCQYKGLPFQPLLLHRQIQINCWWLTIWGSLPDQLISHCQTSSPSSCSSSLSHG